MPGVAFTQPAVFPRQALSLLLYIAPVMETGPNFWEKWLFTARLGLVLLVAKVLTSKGF